MELDPSASTTRNLNFESLRNQNSKSDALSSKRAYVSGRRMCPAPRTPNVVHATSRSAKPKLLPRSSLLRTRRPNALPIIATFWLVNEYGRAHTAHAKRRPSDAVRIRIEVSVATCVAARALPQHAAKAPRSSKWKILCRAHCCCTRPAQSVV